MKIQELESYEIADIQALNAFWKKIIDQYFGPKVLCLLVGPVGSGKTESLKQIYNLYGFMDAASPSFAIHHRALNSQGKILEHVDLYRIQNLQDLESTGFWDLFQSTESWIFVEWGNLLDSEMWPMDWPAFQVEIKVSANGGQRRLILSRFVH